MNYKEIYSELKRIKNDSHNWENKLTEEDFKPVKLNGKVIFEGDNPDDNYQMNYLGSYMSLDPCGKFHHFLSPNGIQKKCERYWDNMEKACNNLDIWLESGEGDGCDVYLCKQIDQ
jgi:hypothetical protein